MKAKNKKEKWIDTVLESLADSKRAKANPDLFSKMEEQFVWYHATAKVIPIHRIKWISVAAILLLLINVFAAKEYIQNKQLGSEQTSAEPFAPKIISNFKLYE